MFYSTILPAVFYITPVAYPMNLVPGKFKFIIMANTLYHYISFFRDILYHNTVPNIHTIIITTVISLFFGIVGVVTFNSLKKGFISHL